MPNDYFDPSDPEWDWDDIDEFDKEPSDDSLSIPAQEYLALYGLDSPSEVIVDFDKIPEGANLRGWRFAALSDAIIFLAEIGLLSFARITVIEGDSGQDPQYAAALPETSDANFWKAFRNAT